MKITVERGWCIASGSCVAECSEAFTQDLDGAVVVLLPEPPAELHQRVRNAARACPAAVITLDE